MNWKNTNLQTRLHLIAAGMLLIGLSSAIVIYLTAENSSDSILGYDVEGGYANPLTPEDSKIYIHNLELYGGKANVFANEFRHWFVGLWHGKSLAFTVACITIVISLGLFFIANHFPSDLQSAARGENNRGGTD